MTDKIIAVSAIIISVSALFVSIYEASLMRQTQRAATWPFIEVLPSRLNQKYFSVRVSNTGVGPARIKDFKITVDGQEMDEGEFRKFLLDFVGDNVGVTWSTVTGRVLPPEKDITFFKLSDSTAFYKIATIDSKIELSLCYCSVFDQCWISNGLNQVKAKNCN